MKAIQMKRFGEPEVLEIVDVPDPVAGDGQAVVVDDVFSTNPWRVRYLEIRGRAEGVEVSGAEIIRIHPERIISFSIDELDKDPHELKPNNRNV